MAANDDPYIEAGRQLVAKIRRQATGAESRALADWAERFIVNCEGGNHPGLPAGAAGATTLFIAAAMLIGREAARRNNKDMLIKQLAMLTGLAFEFFETIDEGETIQ